MDHYNVTAVAELKKIKEELSDARMAYISAKGRGAGLTGARDRMKNLLFSHFDVLLDLFSEVLDLREQNEMLDGALADSDKENDMLRKKVKELEAKAALASPSGGARKSKGAKAADAAPVEEG